MNPLTLIDSLLIDYASPRVRKAVHTTLLLLAVLGTIVLGAEGEWKEAVLALIAAIYAGANQANTPAVELDPAGYTPAEDDGLSYEQYGGARFPETFGEQATPV